MNDYRAHWTTSRRIAERIVVTGDLELLTPTHLGNGDAEGPTDMSLLLDPLTGTRALLTGASVAGALRNYLRERLHGYGATVSAGDKRDVLVEALFGGQKSDDEGAQSALIVDDALGEDARIEIRDGVRIDPRTRTALVEQGAGGRQRGYKFDLELLQAGTRFPLRFELLVSADEKGDQAQQLKQALALALQGLEQGEIPLGARKRRGFGRCQVRQWRVVGYDLHTPAGLCAWLQSDESGAATGPHIAALMGVSPDKRDPRARFEMDAIFWLDGSLLVRSGFGESDTGPDMVHLHSARPGSENPVPVLPGTSLAGVIRHRALRIANTLATNGQGIALMESMFGRSPTEDDRSLTASRVLVHETVIEGTRSLVQNRVKIDRFTGGAFPTALFAEGPIFGGPASRVQVKLTLRNPAPHEIGLLLLVLKDLWTGDLPIGGESSVGRGRLAGLEATLTSQEPEKPLRTWKLTQSNDRLEITGDDKQSLEKHVEALHKYLGGGKA